MFLEVCFSIFNFLFFFDILNLMFLISFFKYLIINIIFELLWVTHFFNFRYANATCSKFGKIFSNVIISFFNVNKNLHLCNKFFLSYF